MKRKDLDEFKLYIKKLYNFMVENGYTLRPAPKFVLNDDYLGGGLLVPTAHYNPDTKTVTIFTNGRCVVKKDPLRSCAHELIHHKQNLEGRLGNGAYEGDKITQDKKLIELEKEAYLYGNIAFRSFCEIEEAKNN